MSARFVSGGFGGGGGTRIAEFSVDIITKGMMRTLDQLDRLEEKLKAIDEKIGAQAKDAPSRERALTGFLDKWGNAFVFISTAAVAAMGAVIAASPALTSSMAEMSYAFEWMAFVLGEQLAPEFQTLSDEMTKTAADFETWFAGISEASREVLSDLAFTLGTAGLGAVIGGAMGTVVPGVGTAAGAVAGAIIGGIAGAIFTDLGPSVLAAIDAALADETLITGVQAAIGGLLTFAGEIAMDALSLGVAIGGAIITGIITYLLGAEAGRSVITVIQGIIGELQGAEFGVTFGGKPAHIPQAAWDAMQGQNERVGGGGGGFGTESWGSPGGTTINTFSPSITITGPVGSETVPYLTSEIEDVLDRQRRGLFSGVRP